MEVLIGLSIYIVTIVILAYIIYCEYDHLTVEEFIHILGDNDYIFPGLLFVPVLNSFILIAVIVDIIIKSIKNKWNKVKHIKIK